MVKSMNQGHMSTGGVNMWDGHDSFLAAICVYTEKMDPCNPWVQIKDDLLYAQTSHGDMKLTYLETYVFVMKRLKARRNGRFVLKGLVPHSTRGAVVGVVRKERTTRRYDSRRQRTHSHNRGRSERQGTSDYVGGKAAHQQHSHSQKHRRDGSRDCCQDGSGHRCGTAVKTVGGTVLGIVVVLLLRPVDIMAIKTVVEGADRIGEGIGSRDIAVGVLLISSVVYDAMHHAVPCNGQRIATTSPLRAGVPT